MQKKDKDLFSVALVGRPNVGKSSLFNVLCQKKLALVKDQPGVTRDLRKGVAKWWGKEFSVCDTGGWTNAEDTISKAIKSKLHDQLTDFDFLIFVCDARQGLTADDKNFFSIIRETGKPFLVALNKCDSDAQDELEFYGLGVDEFFKISCEHKIGISSVIEEIFQNVNDMDIELEDEEVGSHLSNNFPITVVGKPNVGKSSLVNRILKKEQQLVSPLAGTTTDTLSFDGSHGDLEFEIYDTAGIRRKTKLDGELEGLTMLKALETIDKAEFILIVIDGTDKPSRADARLIERCSEQNKPFLIVANKWDLAKETENLNKDTFKKELIREFHFLKSFEVVFVSALTSSGVDKLFEKL
ncbi:MAG: ribosome biogenesis GTPase Der, partial [Bdellovibrionales bacterium]